MDALPKLKLELNEEIVDQALKVEQDFLELVKICNTYDLKQLVNHTHDARETKLKEVFNGQLTIAGKVASFKDFEKTDTDTTKLPATFMPNVKDHFLLTEVRNILLMFDPAKAKQMALCILIGGFLNLTRTKIIELTERRVSYTEQCCLVESMCYILITTLLDDEFKYQVVEKYGPVHALTILKHYYMCARMELKMILEDKTSPWSGIPSKFSLLIFENTVVLHRLQQYIDELQPSSKLTLKKLDEDMRIINQTVKTMCILQSKTRCFVKHNCSKEESKAVEETGGVLRVIDRGGLLRVIDP